MPASRIALGIAAWRGLDDLPHLCCLRLQRHVRQDAAAPSLLLLRHRALCWHPPTPSLYQRMRRAPRFRITRRMRSKATRLSAGTAATAPLLLPRAHLAARLSASASAHGIRLSAHQANSRSWLWHLLRSAGTSAALIAIGRCVANSGTADQSAYKQAKGGKRAAGDGVICSHEMAHNRVAKAAA